MAQIEVNNVHKSFRTFKRAESLLGGFKNLFCREYFDIHAVEDISFSVEPGEIVGYVGPNGAGKSTTIKMLCGILAPSAGTVRVNDLDPWQDRKQCTQNLGVMFGQRSQLWWDLAPIESFRLLQKIYDVPDQQFEQDLEYFCEELYGLKDLLNLPVRQFSLGQKMLCEIVATLLHRPKILFLDEPYIGLDAHVREAVRNFLRKINHERQTTILLTTHDLSELKELCQRVMVIAKGKKIFDDSIEVMRKRHARFKVVELVLSESIVLDDIAGKIQGEFPGKSISVELGADTNHVNIRFDPQELSSAQIVTAGLSNAAVQDLSIQEPKIEDLIRTITSGSH